MSAILSHSSIQTAETHKPARASQTLARSYLVYGIFILCAGLYLLPFMRIMLLRTDEGTLIYGAVRIAQGQVFGRDFFEVIGPGTFYWLAAFFKLFGVTFAATRVCLFLTTLGTGVSIYFLSRRICPTYKTLPSLLLAGAYFGAVWPGISHHVDSNFFALLSFAFMILWHDRGKGWMLIAAGALAGITTCFLQPKGMLLLCAYLVWIAIQRWKRTVSWAAFALVSIGFAAVIGMVAAYFWSHRALWDVIDCNFLWPSKHYAGVNSVPYGQGLFLSYWTEWAGAGSYHAWSIVMAAVLITPLILTAALPGLLTISGIVHRRTIFEPAILLYWLGGSALWLSEFHRRDIYHLVMGSPLLIILFVYLLAQDPRRFAATTLQILAICSACLSAVNLCLTLYAHPIETRAGTVAAFGADPALAYLDAHITPGEEIFAYPYSPMYYFLSATTNPTRYSLLVYNYNTPSQYQEVIRTLEQHKVRYVVWDMTFQSAAVPLAFPNAAHPPAGGFVIEPYLESHYKVVWSDSKTRILERAN